MNYKAFRQIYRFWYEKSTLRVSSVSAVNPIGIRCICGQLNSLICLSITFIIPVRYQSNALLVEIIGNLLDHY